MLSKNISFFYFDEKHVLGYKKKVLEYLKNNEKNFEKVGFPSIIVDFHNMNKIKYPNPTKHLFISDIQEQNPKFEEVCKYVLSKDREIIPCAVMCENKKDYEIIENILRENYGKRAKLTSGFLSSGRLFGSREIKLKKSKLEKIEFLN